MVPFTKALFLINLEMDGDDIFLQILSPYVRLAGGRKGSSMETTYNSNGMHNRNLQTKRSIAKEVRDGSKMKVKTSRKSKNISRIINWKNIKSNRNTGSIKRITS